MPQATLIYTNLGVLGGRAYLERKPAIASFELTKASNDGNSERDSKAGRMMCIALSKLNNVAWACS